MSFLGMDIESALKHARTLENEAANAIFNVLTTMSGLVPELSAHWHGADADAFLQQWEHHRADLSSLHGALVEFVGSLGANIAAQQHVSEG